MSQLNNRPSLMGLKKSVPRPDPVPLTPEIEQQILGTGPASANSEPTTATTSDSARRRKEPTVLMNAKLPASLHSRLKRTAQFNEISMTDILIRAIEQELSNGGYTPPPETWGRPSQI